MPAVQPCGPLELAWRALLHGDHEDFAQLARLMTWWTGSPDGEDLPPDPMLVALLQTEPFMQAVTRDLEAARFAWVHDAPRPPTPALDAVEQRLAAICAIALSTGTPDLDAYLASTRASTAIA